MELPEEMLRLTKITRNETRELAFGSDNQVFCKSTTPEGTTGWRYVGSWNSFERLTIIAMKCFEDNWIVAWNEKFKPEWWRIKYEE
jgi:hypothetical protein